MSDQDDIKQLQALYDLLLPKFTVGDFHSCGLRRLLVKIKERSFELYVDDEYEDLNTDNPLLHFYMMLRTLEIYRDSSDFLDWCVENDVETTDELMAYYGHLQANYLLIERKMGQIDSVISDFDYQHDSGEMHDLRKGIN